MKYYYDVFISHAPEDRKLANQICTLLEAKGYPCYLEDRDETDEEENLQRLRRNRTLRDRMLRGTENSAASQAIRSSRIFLLLVSWSSLGNASVKTELFLANDWREQGLEFLIAFVDDTVDAGDLTADFQYVLENADQVRWSSRRDAHRLVTAVRRKMAPTGIPGLTVELSEAEEDTPDITDEKMSISDFQRYLDEQVADSVDYITLEANRHYRKAKVCEKDNPEEAIAAYERVTLLLDGEWKADNIESRRMLIDSYTQMGYLKQDPNMVKVAAEMAEKMTVEIEGTSDLANLGHAVLVLADLDRKDSNILKQQEAKELYIRAVDIYEDMAAKEKCAENLLSLIAAYWKILDCVGEPEGDEKELYYRKILDATDEVYAMVCTKDKLSYPPLEASYIRLEKYYRPTHKARADKCLVRAGILHLP